MNDVKIYQIIFLFSFISDTVDKWVRKMVGEVLQYRIENKIERNDLLDALIQMRQKKGFGTIFFYYNN